MRRRGAYAVIAAALLGGFVILSIPTSGSLADVGVALLVLALLGGSVLVLRMLRGGNVSEREREMSAREHFDRTGHWPDD
jgi:hypothetical protein